MKRYLNSWCATQGFPKVKWLDGGPEFASKEFTNTCRNNGTKHVVSSAEYPQSNGQVERAMQFVKQLPQMTNLGKEFLIGLEVWRHTPNSMSGWLPAELQAGRTLPILLNVQKIRQLPKQAWHKHRQALLRAQEKGKQGT